MKLNVTLPLRQNKMDCLNKVDGRTEQPYNEEGSLKSNHKFCNFSDMRPSRSRRVGVDQLRASFNLPSMSKYENGTFKDEINNEDMDAFLQSYKRPRQMSFFKDDRKENQVSDDDSEFVLKNEKILKVLKSKRKNLQAENFLPETESKHRVQKESIGICQEKGSPPHGFRHTLSNGIFQNCKTLRRICADRLKQKFVEKKTRVKEESIQYKTFGCSPPRKIERACSLIPPIPVKTPKPKLKQTKSKAREGFKRKEGLDYLKSLLHNKMGKKNIKIGKRVDRNFAPSKLKMRTEHLIEKNLKVNESHLFFSNLCRIYRQCENPKEKRVIGKGGGEREKENSKREKILLLQSRKSYFLRNQYEPSLNINHRPSKTIHSFKPNHLQHQNPIKHSHNNNDNFQIMPWEDNDSQNTTLN
jgi:hypothetical protein